MGRNMLRSTTILSLYVLSMGILVLAYNPFG